ncbi:sensor histidine kinase [Alkanindiges sp. WGS2144]|uniref:sensor histidine kinase n=1 Tax=Alkanindiges sp. WGS2144 TaxID=3366808 RepID=UPI0037519AF1
MPKATHLFSLVNRIIFLFASLVLVLFLVIFIFAYTTSKAEYEQKLYYKIERVGILLERQLRNTPIYAFEGNYKIGEIDTRIKINQRHCDSSRRLAPQQTHLSAACEQLSGFVAQKIYNDQVETYFLNTRNNKVIQVSVLHSDIHDYVLKLTSRILLPYLIAAPVAIIVLFIFLLNSLKPLRLLEQEILRRAPNDFTSLHTHPASKELNSLVSALNQMLERTHQFQLQQQQFIANAAHELRTPLTALSLHLQILKNELATNKHEQLMFIQLEERLHRLQLLVNQMMTLAHQDKLHTEPSRQPVDLSDIIKGCVEQLYPSIEKQGLNLYFTDFEKSLINARTDQLNSIVTNILDNAIKYTSKDGLISVSLKNQADQVVLVIEDSGPGIDESEYQNVFQRFYRLNNAQDIIGSGLGLAIVQQAVQQLNGSIELAKSMLGGLAVIIKFKQPRTLNKLQNP